MANLSYCRFENTAKDLADCLIALQEGEAEDTDLSSTELKYKKQLIQMCIDIATDFGGIEIAEDDD